MKKKLALFLSLLILSMCTVMPVNVSAAEESGQIGGEVPQGMRLLDGAGQSGYYVYDALAEEQTAVDASEYENLEVNDVIPPSDNLLEEQPLPQLNSVEGIVGADDRIKIVNTISQFGSTCLIITVFPNGKRNWGTGWLINNSYVATAGHVLYQKDWGGWATKAAVYVGETGGARKEFKVGYTFYAGQDFVDHSTGSDYTQNGMYDDYGAVKLESPITCGAGHLGLMVANSYADMKGFTYETQGYPGDRNHAAHGDDWQTYDMYYTTGKITGDTWRYLDAVTMDLDFTNGQSGSAIYRYISGKGYYAQAIGVASMGSENFAVLINNWLIKAFQNFT